jgi:hypothetical protein
VQGDDSEVWSPAATAAGDLLKKLSFSRLVLPGCVSDPRLGLRCHDGLRFRPLLLTGGLTMRTEWAFLAGMGVGAVAALMFAPQSGKDTQDLLAGKLRGGLDQVASAGKKVRAQVKDLANRGKENVAEAIDAGQEAYRTSGTEG